MEDFDLDLKKFGLLISQLREDKRISQEKLAELCDVSRNTVVSWESGQKAPKTSAVFRLAAALDCRWVDLMSALLPEEATEEQDEGVKLCCEARRVLGERGYKTFVNHMRGALAFASEIKAS